MYEELKLPRIFLSWSKNINRQHLNSQQRLTVQSFTIKYTSRTLITESVILLTGSKMTTRETKRRIMHHIENFSIRRAVRVGPSRAPPRGASVAPLSIIFPSLSREERHPTHTYAGGDQRGASLPRTRPPRALRSTPASF